MASGPAPISSGAWLPHAAALVTLVLALAAVPSAWADNVDMVFLKSAVAKGAVCLDGTPPVYHFSPGSGSGANNWVVHMEGGGWCKTSEECAIRKGNFRGSSKYMKPLSFSGILGGSQKYNPDFYNWNRVKVRYCDGSSFTGDVAAVESQIGKAVGDWFFERAVSQRIDCPYPCNQTCKDNEDD